MASFLVFVYYTYIVIISSSVFGSGLHVPGDVTLAAMMTVHEAATGGGCSSRVHVSSVMHAEAVTWYIQNLNNFGGLPFSIGIDIYETCGDSMAATQTAVLLMSDVLSGNKTSPLIGVLGPESRVDAAAIAPVLGSVSPEVRLLQLQFSTPASGGDDYRKFQNVASLVPDDDLQIEVMVATMEQLGWKRIAVLYQDDAGVRHLWERLQELTSDRGICVSRSSAITFTNGISSSQITSALEHVIEDEISGLVFLGVAPVAVKVFRALDTSGYSNSPVVILSESASMQMAVFRRADDTLIGQSLGTLSVAPPYMPVGEFLQHWRAIFTNATVFQQRSAINPWLDDVYYDVTGCDAKDCAISQMDAVLYNATFRDYFDDLYTFPASLLNMTTISLSTQGEIDGDNRKYELYNLQSGETLVKVGDFTSGRLILDTSLIRDYNGDIELMWPQLRKAVCPSGHDCDECYSISNLKERYIVDEGDAYIVGINPIFNSDGETGCGEISTTNTYAVVEAIRFAANQINKSNLYFSHLKIGVIVLCTCNNPVVVQRKIYELVKDGVMLRDGTRVNVKDKIIGFIGDVGSTISISVAEVLSRLKYVQISYASTSPALSDRSKYPYFMRTVTPDDAQAKAMIDLLNDLGADYIQVIYSAGAYGEGGRDKVKEEALEADICVSQTIEVTEQNYHLVYDQLLNTASATTVIVFVRSHMVQPLMVELQKRVKTGEFMFIGSEAWSRNTQVLEEDDKQILLGSFTLVLEISPDSLLVDHTKSLDPQPLDENPWVTLYLQEKLGCYFNTSFRKTYANECAMTNPLNKPNFVLDTWSTSAFVATRAMLMGAHQHHINTCGTESTTLCPQFSSPREIDNLVEQIRSVELDLEGKGDDVKVFTANGDGNVGYRIYNVIQDAGDRSRLEYKEVGRYPLEGSFTINLNNAHVSKETVSVCPNIQTCAGCKKEATTVQPQQMSEANVGMIVIGSLFGLAMLAVIVLVVMIVLLRRAHIKDKDKIYLNPTTLERDHTESHVYHQDMHFMQVRTEAVGKSPEATPPPSHCESSGVFHDIILQEDNNKTVTTQTSDM
ncbi:GRM3-like protein [Mya arenaria]|uniref:GRM3-like protein n=1 Tax=Mya arenaria TaxID=6604 RepID=A0ABY7F504_MYAAR|nr:GRM3-like protein [Mya arenaria]